MEGKIDLNVDKWVELNKELNPKAIMLYVYFLSLDKPFKLNKTSICKLLDFNVNTWYVSVNQLRDKGYIKEIGKNEYTIANDLFGFNGAAKESSKQIVFVKKEIPEGIYEDELPEFEESYNKSVAYINSCSSKSYTEMVLNELQKNPENFDSIIMNHIWPLMTSNFNRNGKAIKKLNIIDPCKNYVKSRYQRDDINFPFKFG